MKLKKKFGKNKFELNLTRFQTIGVIIWVFLLLIIPIGVDQFNKYQEYLGQTQESETKETQSRVAGIVSQDGSFFTYTVDLSDKRELVSTLTLVFGSLSAVIALVSLIIFFKEHTKRDRGVFSS